MVVVGVGVVVEVFEIERRARWPLETRSVFAPHRALRPEDMPRAIDRRLEGRAGPADEQAAGVGAVHPLVKGEVAERRVGLAAAARAAVDDFENLGIDEGFLGARLWGPAG